jgi:hypothetical protein
MTLNDHITFEPAQRVPSGAAASTSLLTQEGRTPDRAFEET